MINLERLKLELNNKQYFNNEEYTVFLEENNLIAGEEYYKDTMQVDLLYTVVDVLEALLNDVDMYRKVQTEFMTTGDAVKYFKERVSDIRNKIQDIQSKGEVEESAFSMFFHRN